MIEIMQKVLPIYIIILTIITFVAFGIDKHKATKKKWRIPEKTLLGLAVLGGCIGSLLGMSVFRHKTKHVIFYIATILGILLWGFLFIKVYLL
ncbi:MAG: DUF1294 domain-containing protein [Clostridiales bacterium]|nr:DUF1294 domain-containing protein [Clostridiales bacterium]